MLFFDKMLRNGISNFSYHTTGLWGNYNHLIVEDGTASFALTNGRVVVKRRYVLVWKREEGKLKILRDTFFPDSKR